jgi:hypothetical protein
MSLIRLQRTSVKAEHVHDTEYLFISCLCVAQTVLQVSVYA